MYFVGDVHGKFSKFEKICNNIGSCIQLGDMGIGFGKNEDKLNNLDFYFIRGNHDNPLKCKDKISYLGDYGLIRPDYFFVSGGYSIDKHLRVPYVSWWPEEELNSVQFNTAYSEYVKNKPSVMFSHECPCSVLGYLLSKKKIKCSVTAKVLDSMYSTYQPSLWIFAHHHKNIEFDFGKTHFVCCGELSVYDSLNRKFIDVK